jgi:predicted Zn-ribbon and HTH transcriptional regulator
VGKTRRQEIVELLSADEWSFDDLRHELQLTVKVLEEDLHHIRHSVRSNGLRLHLGPARCEVCDFEFTSDALHPPGRCPNCRDRRIQAPCLKITA